MSRCISDIESDLMHAQCLSDVGDPVGDIRWLISSLRKAMLLLANSGIECCTKCNRGGDSRDHTCVTEKEILDFLEEHI